MSQGASVLLMGEAGVGKTRMLEESIRLAEAAGRRVLRGRAVPGPQVPFRAFVEVFAGASRRFGIPDEPGLRPFRGPLSRVVADWPSPAGGVADPLLVGEGVLRLLKVLAGEGGLVLGLEDMHWADSESLAALEYVCEHGPAERLVTLATVRDEGTEEAVRLLRRLAGRRAATWLRLVPFSREEVHDLCRACLQSQVPPEGVDFVAEHADGLPYAVEQLIAGLVSTGAKGVEPGNSPASGL